MENTIHKGKITEKIAPHIYNVWLPSGGGLTPYGEWQQVGENTGGQLYGAAWAEAVATAKPCIVASELSSGSWFTYLPSLDASVFNNKYKDGDPVYDYRIVTKYKPPIASPYNTITMESDFGAIGYSPCAPTLNLVGGHPIPLVQNVPTGTFLELKPGQDVLVVFPQSSAYGIIIASIPSAEEYRTMIK